MRIYLLKGRHGFRPQDGFKFMSVVPNVKDLFLFSDAKLLHCCELFVRYYVVFAFLLINIAISIRFTIKGIIYYIITIPHYILCICTSVFSIVCTIIVFIGLSKALSVLICSLLLLFVFFKFLMTTTPSLPTTKSFFSSCEKAADDTFPALEATPEIPSPRSLYCSKHSEKSSTE